MLMNLNLSKMEERLNKRKYEKSIYEFINIPL